MAQGITLILLIVALLVSQPASLQAPSKPAGEMVYAYHLIGVGARVAEHTIHSIPVHPSPAFEDIRLQDQ